MKKKPSVALALPLPGTVTTTSLTLTGQLPFKRYLETAALLGKIGHGVQWWLGDLLVYGDKAYGEKYAQAEAETGFDPGTLANITSVCDRVEPSRRRAALSFAHHVEVAKLTPDEQTRWLEVAEKKGWTRAELRRALKGESGAGGDGNGGGSRGGENPWDRLREGLDIVKEAREKLERFPEHQWTQVEVKDLIVRLEKALVVEGR